MKPKLIMCAVALLLTVTTTPAAASTTAEEGNVGLTVRGSGLTVDRAGGWRDGHGRGVKARLYTVHKGLRTELRGWKAAKRVTAGGQRFMDVDWTLNTRHPHGSWLCIEFTGGTGAPCARIHR